MPTIPEKPSRPVGEDENVLGPRDRRMARGLVFNRTNWWSGTLLLIVTRFEILCCDVAYRGNAVVHSFDYVQFYATSL
jgi:hypothetical protein